MLVRIPGVWIAILGLSTALACPTLDDPSDDDASDDDMADDDDDTETGLDPCGFGTPPAATVDIRETFDISQWTADVVAMVENHPQPTEQQVLLVEGPCRYRKLQGLCDPPCGPDELCTGTDGCAPRPVGVSAGTLTITGLGKPIVVEEYLPGAYHHELLGSPQLFSPGALIGASFAGDVYPAVSLEAQGVANIDTGLQEVYPALESGQDLALTWVPGENPGACFGLSLFGPVSSHGLPPNHVLECVVPDEGSLTVPSAVVDAFVDGGGTIGGDCFTVTYARFSRQTDTHNDDPARLLVRSIISRTPICIGQ